ncbi:MAG: cellulase family glycosylhydrolase [Solirubrobacterales bacterium]
MRAKLPIPVLLVVACLLAPAAAGAKPWIGVDGNRLVDRQGNTVRLLGLNRSGTEYKCVHREGFFEGPSDSASIEVMRRWHINAVRVPLNESCLLGINWVPPAFGGEAYRAEVRGYVERLEQAGLYVILELQWAAPKTFPAEGLLPMPDAEHSLDFWRTLASEYRDDRSVIFDIYNEPRPGVSWDCWQHGCAIDDHWIGWYDATGMTQLIETVRATGARQPIMVPGIDWASDLSGWLAHLPPDPLNSLVAANHTYGGSTPCRQSCRQTLLNIAQTHPVVTGELGEGDCRHKYIDGYMPWADANGISYLAWAWTSGAGWDCEEGPSLIKNYGGKPTNYGVGYRDHLRQLAREGLAP